MLTWFTHLVGLLVVKERNEKMEKDGNPITALYATM